ncbi:MAG: transporter [Bdellovibrionales bacterium]|nr:transporter [Bdellovibrionales bacterium]
MIRSLHFLALILTADLALADELNHSDKSAYHLFNPTPKELMRELATDRPDKTESAYSVDAGHFQFESDILIFSSEKTTDNGADVSAKSFAVMATNLKLGLTNSIDFQAIITPYATATENVTGGSSEELGGFGDTTLRLKVNLFGNDGGAAALAIMPFITLPTNSGGLGHKMMEGGLIVPIAASLPADWKLGSILQWNRAKNRRDDGFHHEWISTLTLGHDLFGDLAGYAEFWNLASTEPGSAWAVTVDFGLTYMIMKNVQLDAGMNVGVTDAADDLNPFLGVSALF